MKLIRAIFTTLLIWCCSLPTVAQEDSTHVLDGQRHSSESANQQPLTVNSNTIKPIESRHTDIDSKTLVKINPGAIDISSIRQTDPSLMRWQNGAIFGSSRAWSNHGLGYGNSASLFGIQQWGNLTLRPGMTLSKDFQPGIGIINGASLNIAMDYSFSPLLSVTAFGGMRNAGFLQRGSSPVTDFHYGGYFTLQNEDADYGVSLGMRRMYNAMTGQWTNVPVVVPYIKAWGQKIGFDVGPLLMHSIKGMNSWLNPGRPRKMHPRRGGGIIMPQTTTIQGFGPPDIPYIK